MKTSHRNNSRIINILWFILIMVLMGFLLFGCSAGFVDKNKTETKTNQVEKTTSSTNQNSQEWKNEFEQYKDTYSGLEYDLEPIDPQKPMTEYEKDGKRYTENARRTYRETSGEKTGTKTANTKSQDTTTTQTDTHTETDTEQSTASRQKFFARVPIWVYLLAFAVFVWFRMEYRVNKVSKPMQSLANAVREIVEKNN